MHIELTFLMGRRFIKVTLFHENLFHFPLDILPNCFLYIFKNNEVCLYIPLYISIMMEYICYIEIKCLAKCIGRL